MAGCGVKVDYVVPTRYSCKVLRYPCGATGIDGAPVLCDDCEKLHAGRDWRREAEEAGERWEPLD